MKNIQFITLLAIILLGANASSLRKETAGTKSTVKMVSAEIAEPIHYENQYHSGGDISPEIVYAPVQFRFKETEQLSENETSLGQMKSGVSYSSVETVQTEPESEGGFFSPEIVSRFAQVDKVSKNTDERRHKKHKKEEAKEEPKEETEKAEAKQEEAAPVEAKEGPIDETEAKKVEQLTTQAKSSQEETEHPEAKVEQTEGQDLQAKIKKANKKGLDILHPEGYDKEYEQVSKVAHISDYSKEDLQRIANGGARVFIPVHHDDTYNMSPEIYHHVIQSATTEITTARSPLTEVKKVLWRDFVPPSNGFTNVVFAQQQGQTVPDVHRDELGHDREYWANVLNYPTPVDVGDVLERPSSGLEDLTNVANPIQSRSFQNSYDHEVVPNPVE